MRRIAALALLALLAACHTLVVVAELDNLSSGTSTSEATTSPGDTTTPTTGEPSCELPPPGACDDLDPLRSIGLACNDEANVEGVEYMSPEPGALRSTRQFGNATWNPRSGELLLALSTGFLPAPDPNQRIAVDGNSATPGTANGNPDTTPPPDPVDTAAIAKHWPVDRAYDMVALRFLVTVPANARGFALDLAFLTAEYPQRSDLELGDSLLLWISGEAFTGDLASLGTPVTVPALRAAIAGAALIGDHPALVSTGFAGLDPEPCDYGWISYPQCPRGGALPWSTVRGAVSPGDRITVVIALADLNDAQRDSVALLDHWRWTCDACDASGPLEANACGLAPAS
jgi:hypothetical protein